MLYSSYMLIFYMTFPFIIKINLIFKSLSIYLYSVHRIWIQLNFSLYMKFFILMFCIYFLHTFLLSWSWLHLEFYPCQMMSTSSFSFYEQNYVHAQLYMKVSKDSQSVCFIKYSIHRWLMLMNMYSHLYQSSTVDVNSLGNACHCDN